ncbi:MAG: G1 family glutamic endopeptidase, partial [Actinocrinis sp.]
MSVFHRAIRTVGTVALAAAPLALPVATPAIAAAPLLHAPVQHVGAVPFFVSHGFTSHGRNATTTSGNWGGYAAHGSTYTSVSASWVQTAVNCSKGSGYSSFWVGLDGYDSNSVEQTGTEADCSGGRAVYSSWYEMYPAYPVNYGNAVRPGDHFTATVTYQGSNRYRLVLTDSTAGWTRTTSKTQSGLSRASAEVIAEAPSSNSGVLPLSDFGTVNFTGSTVNGASLGSTAWDSIDIVDSRGTTEATTSSLSGGTSFSVTWKART